MSHLRLVIFFLLLLSCNKEKKDDFKEYPFQPLEFHFAQISDINHIAAFGIPDWSGPGKPHTDLDLSIDPNTVNKSTILSPTCGTISSVTYKTFDSIANPSQLMMVSVKIYINRSFTVDMVFEPGEKMSFLDTQLAAIKVKQGQEVFVGDTIGDLLGGTYESPTLALRLIREKEGKSFCPYLHSSDNAKSIYDLIAATYNGLTHCGSLCCSDSLNRN